MGHDIHYRELKHRDVLITAEYSAVWLKFSYIFGATLVGKVQGSIKKNTWEVELRDKYGVNRYPVETLFFGIEMIRRNIPFFTDMGENELDFLNQSLRLQEMLCEKKS